MFFHRGRVTTAQHFCTAVERMMPQLVCSVLGVSSSAESVALYSGGGILLGSCCQSVFFFIPPLLKLTTFYQAKYVNMLQLSCHSHRLCTHGMPSQM